MDVTVALGREINIKNFSSISDLVQLEPFKKSCRNSAMSEEGVTYKKVTGYMTKHTTNVSLYLTLDSQLL